jgi:hypothetical protein
MQTVMRDAFADWPRQRFAEFESSLSNGEVGDRLLSQSDRARVWSIRLAPGERIGFHRHVLDYFWTALTAGKARSHYGDGRIVEASYSVGETKHFRFAAGESMIHDLENIGDTELAFVTVEYLDSANPPLPLD